MCIEEVGKKNADLGGPYVVRKGLYGATRQEKPNRGHSKEKKSNEVSKVYRRACRGLSKRIGSED